MFCSLSETSFEIDKVSREFSLLPRSFLGALIDKFMGGSLGAKGWPAGSIKVAELFGEYSFLGLETISRCCKYRGYLSHGWMAQHMKRELYEGEFECTVSVYKLQVACNGSLCTVSELNKHRLAYKLERWGVDAVCMMKDVAKPVSAFEVQNCACLQHSVC